MWIGVDDTDGPEGGCTTHVLTEIVRVARDHGIDVIGEPRLVRLNPNIEGKTRGNGALAVRLGTGRGHRTRIGVIAGRPVWSYATGGPIPRSGRSELVEALWAAVLAGSDDDAATDPAMIAGDRPLPARLYDRAVRSVVPLPEVEGLLRSAGFTVRVRGDPRGLVGAASAVAWPGRRATWELLAYRTPRNLGRPRRVGVASVRAARRRFPSLFLCYDARTRRMLVAPHTPCPILFGLRSTDPRVLSAAARRIRSEPVDRWLRFRTNQATGDHVRARLDSTEEAFTSGRLVGTVGAPPTSLRGGHTRFDLIGPGGGRTECIAFEPTKVLPAVAASLIPGETVEVWGGRGRDPTFRVEGIVLAARPSLRTPGPRPRCIACDRTARSLGRGRGFRCPSCRARFPPEARSERRVVQRFGAGTYHPTPSARRHLARIGPETDSVMDL